MRTHQPPAEAPLVQRCGIGSTCDCPHEDKMAGIQRDIQRATTGGSSLPEPVRESLGHAFDHDFTGVRIHTGPEAARVAAGLGARALTVGTDILFGAGEYRPGTSAGDHVLRHELAHVVQQAHHLPHLAIDGGPADPLEVAAEHAATRIRGEWQAGNTVPGPGPPVVQRLGESAPAFLTMSCTRAVDSPAGVLRSYRFARGSSRLDESDRSDLAALAASRPSGARLRVDGYASVDGPEAENLTLSCDRATAVADALSAPAVETYAHGEGSEFGATRADNRRATVSERTAPAAPAAALPAVRCGPDVTAEIRAAAARTRARFGGWSTAERNDACGALTSVVTGAIAWDIIELHNNAWILGYRPDCATAGATPACGSTVAVDGECSYAGSPNYVIFGVMCRLCHDHLSATGASSAGDFTEAGMLRLVNLYKGTGPLGIGTPSGNFGPSRDWASAGYHGWPGVPSPAGDRPTCAPVCPTPYAGRPFHVNWVPLGVF